MACAGLLYYIHLAKTNAVQCNSHTINPTFVGQTASSHFNKRKDLLARPLH